MAESTFEAFTEHAKEIQHGRFPDKNQSNYIKAEELEKTKNYLITECSGIPILVDRDFWLKNGDRDENWFI